MSATFEMPIIEFPLRGEWKVVMSPGHHRYAFDFAAVGGTEGQLLAKSLLHLLMGKATVSDSYSWAAPVYSPFDCEVVRADDGWPDRKKLSPLRDLLNVLKMSLFQGRPSEHALRTFVGNYVILRSQTAYAFMAHMQCDSLTVHVGQQLACGEVIGRVGNTGNSLAPHLHLQLMDAAEVFRSNIISFRLRRYEKWNGKTWDLMENGVLDKGEHIRYTAA